MLPAFHSRRTGIAVLIAIVIAIGVGERFSHLGAAINHFDEVFPTVVIARFRATGSLDMNLNDVNAPAISRFNQYAGSSYHYALLGWDEAARRFPGWPNEDHFRPPAVRLRAFSAVTSSIALTLLAIGAWRRMGPIAALVATVMAALNPTLVQDAHYARPEAFLLLLTILFGFLVGRTRAPSLPYAVIAGLVLGILVAAKNTMVLLAALPLIWIVDPETRPAARVAILWCAGATVLAFGITEPGAWLHFSAFMEGVRRLQTQYAHPFPVNGPLGGGASYGMADDYFRATLGTGTAFLFAVGIIGAFRRRDWPMLVTWAAPWFAFGILFGSKPIFFERAYSPFLPGLFLFSGLGCKAMISTVRPKLTAALAFAAIAVAPGALVTFHLVGDELSGGFAARRIDYDARISACFPTVPIVSTPMWSSAHIENLVERWNRSHEPFIARVSDFSDEWTRRAYTQLLSRLPAHEFQTLLGPFSDFPVCTLQTYHEPTWRYVWIGAPLPSSFPLPAPAGDSAAVRAAAALLSPAWPYWLLAILAGLLPVLLAFCALGAEAGASESGAARLAANLRAPWLFVASLFAVIIAFRWPVFFHRPELNVDEAHTIAGAITLSFDPVYWRSVDGTTHGPLNDFILLSPRLFGWPINFLTARVVGTLLIAGALTCLWVGDRVLWGDATARFATLPPAAFFALSNFWDFVHYTSEHLSIFLLAVGWSTLVVAGKRRPFRWSDSWLWAAGGAALGAVPYAKMQGVPVAAALALFGLFSASKLQDECRGARVRSLVPFCMGLLMPSVLCAAHLWVFNLGHDFEQSYLVNNFLYATQTKMFTVWQMVEKLPSWLGDLEGAIPIVYGAFAFLAVAMLFVNRINLAGWQRIGFSAALAAVSLYSSVAPGRQFHHYLLFALIPFTGLASSMFAAVLPGSLRMRFGVACLFLASTVLPQVVAKVERPNPYLGDVARYDGNMSNVSRIVLHYARQGEALGIWGFMPRFYVETGLRQASREGHNERQLLANPQLAYYRLRYLSDLQRNQPPVFLDAVGDNGFWPLDRNQFAHELWPELRDWVARGYSQVADVEGVRIFVRNDRLSPQS